MQVRTSAEIVVGVVALVGAGLGFSSWKSAHDADLTAEVEARASKQMVEHLQEDLKQRISDLESEKQRVVKLPPAQQAPQVTRIFNLPQPIKVEQQTSPVTGKIEEVATMPATNLTPLFAAGIECQKCQEQLKEKIQENTQLAQRVESLNKTVKGTFWSNLKKGTRWVITGAAAGALALCVSGHCK